MLAIIPCRTIGALALIRSEPAPAVTLEKAPPTANIEMTPQAKKSAIYIYVDRSESRLRSSKTAMVQSMLVHRRSRNRLDDHAFNHRLWRVDGEEVDIL